MLRPLCENDAQAWRGLWTAYLEFYEASVRPEVYETTFRRLLAEDMHMFHARVAEYKGELVGLVHFLFHGHCWRTENVCYLQDLYVVPRMRGKSVGRALIEAVYAHADALGCPDVYWLTQDFNTNARRLYDRIGRKTPFIKYQRPAT